MDASFVTPDATPDKIAAKPLTDHTKDLIAVRSGKVKRRITFAADIANDETEGDTDDITAGVATTRQLWSDDNEAIAHKSALDFFDYTEEVSGCFQTSTDTANFRNNCRVTESPTVTDTLKSKQAGVTDKAADSIEAPHDSPVRHCAKSWREIDEDGAQADDEASDDELSVKTRKMDHLVTCHNCSRTYDGFAQCCYNWNDTHEDEFTTGVSELGEQCVL